MPGEAAGAAGGPLLLLWAPSKLLSELRAFALPELHEKYRQVAVQRSGDAPADPASPPQPLPPLSLRRAGDALRADVAPGPGLDEELLAAAAARCTLLTAAIRALATAPTLEQAAAAAAAALPPDDGPCHPLRVLSLGCGARAPADQFLRMRLQQLSLGTAPAPGQPALWCIQQAAGEVASREQQLEQQGEVVLGLEVVAGAAPYRPSRRLGPTAMLPELAALSASLAGGQRGALVLDPFCGSGALLAATTAAGAVLAVGADIDATHFAGGCNGGSDGTTVLLQADAASLVTLLPGNTVDAVLTDIPYGFRTEVAAAGAPPADATATVAEPGKGWQRLLHVLLQLAGHVLVPGGRLLAWMPLQLCTAPTDGEPSAEQQSTLEALGAQQRLRLLHLLPETRRSGYARGVAVFERQRGRSSSSSGNHDSRRAQLLAALGAAAAGGAPVFHLSRGQAGPAAAASSSSMPGLGSGEADGASGASAAVAVQRRDVIYKQARGRGAAIDVWRAAWLGDAAAIAEYAAAGGDVNAGDRKGQAPLQFAAGYGKDACVELLLQLGADPSAAADRSGMAALHRAAARNHVATLRLLLGAGADCWQRSAVGQTPLMYSSQFGHGTCVALLLQHLAAAGAVGGATSSDGGGSGASSSVQRHLTLVDAAGLTALHLTAQWGVPAIADALMQAGADPNRPSACDTGITPAHLAARWGHPQVLTALQRHGADLQRRDARGWTPLQEAEEWRRGACVDLLRAI